MTGEKGMTLVELMVCLVVILVVMAGATAAYLKLMTGFKTQSRVSETYMANMCGMEMLRFDIEMAGYGLPRSGNPTNLPSYNEAVTDGTYAPNPVIFNDSPVVQGTPPNTNGIPRPFVFSANGGLNNSDVLVIKSSVAGTSDASKKWSIIYFDATTAKWVVRQWGNAGMDMAASDRFIVLNQSFAALDKQLQLSGTWNFAFTTALYTDASALPTPASTSDIHTIYALGPSSATRMPFNRADYHLYRPAANFPQKCYPNSTILYRSTINHGDGKRNEQAVLDCVEDFQVAFGLDTNDDRTIDSWQTSLAPLDDDANGITDALEIRNQLREVRVFILYHEGSKDEDFRFSGALTLGDAQTGTLSTFTPSSDAATCSRCGQPLAMHYRWNVARLAIKPMNLQ
jgi:prepilin-type N-terminal cleavage/methylation domain-containing protein